MATTTTQIFESRPEDIRRAKRDRQIRRFQEHILPRILLVIVCVIFILPFYWMLTLGLKSNAELTQYPPTLYPHDPQWGNFKLATEAFAFWKYLGNTVIVTALTILGAVISNPIIAYGFSRLEWPGRDKVFMIVLATVFMPFPVIIVALFDIYSRLHWINSFAPLVVPMFFGNAFWIFLMRQFMMQIPKDLSDAARMDGANEFQIFAQIILPLCKPALGVIAIFAGLHAWNDFLGPLLFLLKESKYTLALGLTFFQSTSTYDVRFNLMMAAATLIVLPVIALFFFFQRAFVSGLTIGSLK
ncbi:MAG TPA: carbohydrate ABC transporter permease [Thermomicrobiales bacterium]|nr:carbohydrate ABC transporter permease [Thermomicrobiales bacterium]